MATLEARYYNTIKFIAAFKQLPTKHIHDMLFSDSKSMNPCYNTLNQLKGGKFITTLEHPYSGGRKGGSNPLVWILDTEGYNLLYGKKSQPLRGINYHTLDIAHTFMELVQLSRAGRFTIEGYATEPSCWLKINGREVRPDLYLETRSPSGLLVKSFLEIDRGTEWETKIKSQLSDYVYAFNHVDTKDFPEWPRTIWVTPDHARAMQLQRWINNLPPDDRQLFKICERSGIADMFI